MDGILRALGFDSKPDFAEKIPESLKASDFNVHEVSLAVVQCIYTRRSLSDGISVELEDFVYVVWLLLFFGIENVGSSEPRKCNFTLCGRNQGYGLVDGVL